MVCPHHKCSRSHFFSVVFSCSYGRAKGNAYLGAKTREIKEHKFRPGTRLSFSKIPSWEEEPDIRGWTVLRKPVVFVEPDEPDIMGNVTAHVIGHCLGIEDHHPDTNNIMYDSIPRGTDWDPNDVKEGVIASRIAAHAADIVKGVKGAQEWDRRMSTARKNLDWEEQVRLSLDPNRAQKVHGVHSTTGGACSMCGEFCAMELVTTFLGGTRHKC